ncbi:MAG: hypothetical protein NXI20_25300 [bacterium]|nr:hypothetical protein [bacterium]
MIRLSILFLFSFSLSSYAQQNGSIVQSTDVSTNHMDLNKETLINEANRVLASKYPDFDFDTLSYDITAWRNSEKTIVKYQRIIRFTPLGKKEANLTFDFEVNLINKEVSPFDFWGFEKFYIPTIEEQEKMQFVINAFDLPYGGFTNSIVEEPEMYIIYVDNEYAFGQYHIDKITGKECLGSIEGSYAPMPEDLQSIEKDPLIEIKE